MNCSLGIVAMWELPSANASVCICEFVCSVLMCFPVKKVYITKHTLKLVCIHLGKHSTVPGGWAKH